jgi:hypothetical protein
MTSGRGSTSRKVWTRVECVVRGDRGPYHWTDACLSRAESLVAIDRDDAVSMSNLRPCKLCASRSRR